MVHKGHYVDLVETEEGNLRFVLTEAGREELEEKSEDERYTDVILFEFLEDHMGEGWDYISPEEIGALTTGTVIAYDVGRDDHGELESETLAGSRLYWDAQYQIKSTVEELYRNGEYEWMGVEAEV